VTETTRVDVRAGQVSIVFERPGSFLVQVIAFDGQRCTLGLPRLVECPNGYQAVNGACQPVRRMRVPSGLHERGRGMPSCRAAQSMPRCRNPPLLCSRANAG
jgi:hypothetical protein